MNLDKKVNLDILVIEFLQAISVMLFQRKIKQIKQVTFKFKAV